MDFERMRKRIRERRKYLGMTQEELADKVDISTMSIRRYESGERLPKHETVEKIAKALQCDISELMSPKEEGDLIIQNLIDSLESSSNQDQGSLKKVTIESTAPQDETSVEGDYLVCFANFLIQNAEEISMLQRKGYSFEIIDKEKVFVRGAGWKIEMGTKSFVEDITQFSKLLNYLLDDFHPFIKSLKRRENNAPQA